MLVRIANFWYFFFIILSAGLTVGLYYLLRNKSEKTKKWVLFSLLAFALVVHFLKLLIPPYNTNAEMRYRDSWFINICGANIFLFPFFFLSKNKILKDYMFYLGILGGGLAIIYPTEALNKTLENPYYLEVIRFYLHHWILFAVPLLMVMLKVHDISYKRAWSAPTVLLVVMLFIMLNQVLQGELGFTNLRNGEFLEIGYRNNSFIWGPGDDALAKIFTWACPKFFRTVPVGQFAGQEKYWPWFWIIIPAYAVITPIAFGLSMIFDSKAFGKDVKGLFLKIKKTK